jgi:hypothetical protein
MTTPMLPAKMLLIENDPAAADKIRAALAAAGARMAGRGTAV